MHDRPYFGARSDARSYIWPCAASRPAAWPCSTVAQLCAFPACFPWFSRFYLTLNLPWSRSWILAFFRNMKMFPESKAKHIIGTIWLEGSKFDPFSSRFDMKAPRNMDYIRAKMRWNIGTILFNRLRSYLESIISPFSKCICPMWINSWQYSNSSWSNEQI